MLAGALAQFLFMGSEVPAMGAFGAIFGLMLVAYIWAPANHITAWIMIFVTILGNTDIRISRFALLFVAWNLLVWALNGFRLSGAALHLFGAGLGFAVGTVMVKRGSVDAEDEDLFSLRRKRREFATKVQRARAAREAVEDA